MGFSTLTTSGAVKTGTEASVDLATATGSLAVSHLPTTATVVTSTATGAQNNWDPGITGNTTIFWNGASAMAVTGFVAGTAGQMIYIRNITAAQTATFAHASASSDVGKRLTNAATSAVTPIGPGGFGLWVYSGSAWILVAHDSQWITPAFSAGNYTGSGSLTWTVESGDVDLQQYRLQLASLEVRWAIITTSTGGTASTALQIGNGAWGGFTIAAGANWLLASGVQLDAGGASAIGRIRADTTNATTILCQLINGGNWSNAAVNNTYVRGAITFQVT